MTFPKVLLFAASVALFLSGCRSGDELELYRPKNVTVYETAPVREIAPQRQDRPRVLLDTSVGNVVIELYADEAPISTQNFLEYVESGFYEGTVFHRVIPGFVVQAGGYTADMTAKETGDPIPNEAGNGLRNFRGTVAMARLGNDMDSATSQFYINLVDNERFLDGDGRTDGYAVFGRVVEGMDVVDQIGFAETGTRGDMSDVPVDPIIIESAQRVKQ